METDIDTEIQEMDNRKMAAKPPTNETEQLTAEEQIKEDKRKMSTVAKKSVYNKAHMHKRKLNQLTALEQQQAPKAASALHVIIGTSATAPSKVDDDSDSS